MKIVIITNNFTVPYKNFGGDFVITNFGNALIQLGHNVNFYDPIEFNKNIFNEDIIHDFSFSSKEIVEKLLKNGNTNIISTSIPKCGNYKKSLNTIVWSEAMKKRGQTSSTDYKNTPFSKIEMDEQCKIDDAHVVYGGVDTDFYCPTNYKRENFFLWMNNWHHEFGYQLAINLAKRIGTQVILAGDHPDYIKSEIERKCAIEASELAKNVPNIQFYLFRPNENYNEQKRKMYRMATLLLDTTQFQGSLGFLQMECLASGTPVISTNYGSSSEVISNGLTGYTCSNNSDAFLNAIMMIHNIDPRNCRDEAVKRFDIKTMAQNYLEQYQMVLDGKTWG